MNQKIDVSVYVPALNEEATISETAARIARGCAAMGATFEILFVDDGSRDGTLAEMRRVAAEMPGVHVFHHRRPRGITHTMITAFPHARGDVVIWIPADLESDPEVDIPLLLGKLRSDNLDVVCGWRQGRRDGKNLASWVYNSISRRLFPVAAHDMNWIKAFKRECLEDLELRSDWHRFLVMIWAERGYRIGEVPTQWHPRKSSRSKFGIMRMPVSFFDVLALRFLLTFSRKPMLFFGSAGALVGLTGILTTLYLAFMWFFERTQRRPVFYFALVLIVIGFLLLCVGFLAEMICRGHSVSPVFRRDDRGPDDPGD